MKILVTGGAGFIGSAVVRLIIEQHDDIVMNVDKLTYAGNPENLTPVEDSNRYRFARIDICDKDALAACINDYRPDVIMHLAAESHVDRSIDDPGAFVQTNVIGTFNLLTIAQDYYNHAADDVRCRFRFLHVSTDEVYGSLGDEGMFTETTPYNPNSPYSASKASSDHFVRAWRTTFGLPTLITNCSNNYGPYHFPEKMIPLMILNAIEGKPLPVYGDGQQVRDWLHVEDHARALYLVATQGQPGETYNIGGNNEVKNLDVVKTICELLEERANLKPPSINRFEDLITFVEDRPGHDLRYAIDASKIRDELGWTPEETFKSGLAKTIDWYLDNLEWCERVQSGKYQRERLGTIKS